nr:CatA-like O-acetyltransferase [Maliibacterium massiliense]
MALHPIDMQRWPRREIYETFKRTSACVTVQLDVAALYAACKARGRRFFPAVLYCLATIVNRHAAYRYAYDAQGHVCLWDEVHPFYTVPRGDAPDLFAMKYTAYTPDFAAFYDAYVADAASASAYGRLLCDASLPDNRFCVTSMPGTHFSAFNFCGDPKDDLAPCFVLGKFAPDGAGRLMLPLCGEFAHAVNDGVHISRFFRELEELVRQPDFL